MGYESWLPSMPQGLFAGEGTRVSRQTFSKRRGKACIGEIAVHLRRRKVVERRRGERRRGKRGKKERRDGERALWKRRVISLAMTSNTIQRRTNLEPRTSLLSPSDFTIWRFRSLTPKEIIREDLYPRTMIRGYNSDAINETDGSCFRSVLFRFIGLPILEIFLRVSLFP